jgi:predicted transglutaminase-like cysteine proteinase
VTVAVIRRRPAAALLFLCLLCALCLVPAGASRAGATEINGEARSPLNSPVRSGQSPATPFVRDSDWSAVPDGRPAPGELRLRGYTVLPAKDREAKNLQAAWDRIMREHNPERFFTPHPNFDKERLAQWRKLAAKMPRMSEEEVLRHINGFFNGWPSKKDMDTYGEEEHWATPEEFVSNNGGDCEDYAVVKYMALRNFGVPAENMWILSVRDRSRNEYHAVLAVYAGGRLFVLDNLSRPSYLLIPEAVFLKTFTPLAAVNENGILLCTPEEQEDGARAGEAGPGGGHAGR